MDRWSVPPNKELPKTALRAGGGTFPFRTQPHPFIVCMSDPPPILHHLPLPLRHAWSETIGLFKIVSVSCGINKLALKCHAKIDFSTNTSIPLHHLFDRFKMIMHIGNVDTLFLMCVALCFMWRILHPLKNPHLSIVQND